MEKDIENAPPGENTAEQADQREQHSKKSSFQSLGLLDRYLAVWILLAMVIGIILGNFVPNIGPALQKGEFVGVSVPIGMCSSKRSTQRSSSQC